MVEMLMAMEILNPESYKAYRDRMTPILHSHGGSFGYDFIIQETLISETKDFINRVFTIRFPSEESSQKFFDNEKYLAIKEEFFVPAVGKINMIAKYERS